MTRLHSKQKTSYTHSIYGVISLNRIPPTRPPTRQLSNCPPQSKSRTSHKTYTNFTYHDHINPVTHSAQTNVLFGKYSLNSYFMTECDLSLGQRSSRAQLSDRSPIMSIDVTNKSAAIQIYIVLFIFCNCMIMV